jgi:hypothetical protein
MWGRFFEAGFLSKTYSEDMVTQGLGNAEILRQDESRCVKSVEAIQEFCGMAEQACLQQRIKAVNKDTPRCMQ